MSFRKKKKKVDLDDLLPDEVVAGNSLKTSEDLARIVEDLTTQLEEANAKFSTMLNDLKERIDLLEDDFKTVVKALAGPKSPSSSPPTQASTPQTTPPQNTGVGRPSPPKL